MFDFFTSGTNIFLLIVALVVGLILIIYGGNWFVDSSIWIAKVTHLPELLIGATIVSIGTTLPEVFVSFMSAATGETAMAVGNATGSIICNLALIFGITLCVMPTLLNRKDFISKFIFLIVAVFFLTFATLDSSIALWEGIILILIFAAFITLNIISALKKTATPLKDNVQAEQPKKKQKAWVMIVLFIIGAIAIAFGANLLIDSVSALAEKAGVSTQIISLTIVALGTSLPELITMITSVRKSNPAITMGNIIGANILNATLVLGGSATIAGGISIPSTDFVSLLVSFAIIFTLTAILFIPILAKSKTYRWQGIAYEAIYLGYLIFLITKTLLK